MTEKEVVVNIKISSMLASRTRKLTNASMPKVNLSDSHIFRHSAKGLFPGFKVGMKEVDRGGCCEWLWVPWSQSAHHAEENDCQ